MLGLFGKLEWILEYHSVITDSAVDFVNEVAVAWCEVGPKYAVKA